MAIIFAFEDEFIQTLRCIPMQVRYKLDTCGIKLKLQDWSQLALTDRQWLLHQPCDTAADITNYRERLCTLVYNHRQELPKDLPIDPNPPWHNAAEIPPEVQAKAREVNVSLTHDLWASLTPLQRFALIKLSRPSHENHNFLPAIAEFCGFPRANKSPHGIEDGLV